MTLSPLQYSGITPQLAETLANSLAGLGYRLVRVKFTGGRKAGRLQIMGEPADGRQMTVNDCEQISRMVAPLLDVEDPFGGAYDLEVSSPGIDRPLVSLSDFTRFVGHEVKLELDQLLDGRKRFRGVLQQPAADMVVLVDEGKEWQLPFAQVRAAKLILTDTLLAQAQQEQDILEQGANEDDAVINS